MRLYYVSFLMQRSSGKSCLNHSGNIPHAYVARAKLEQVDGVRFVALHISTRIFIL